MHYYTYDGSFEGLLSVIFEVYEHKAWPDKIDKQGQEQPGIFASSHHVLTDEAKAARVWNGLQKKLSESACTDLYKTYLWEQPGFEMLIFRYVELVFASKTNIEENFAEDCVRHISQISKQIFREKHRMEAFIRFQKTEDGLFYATISPDFNVLPLLKTHFQKRYADQAWLIYDVKRRYGLHYDLENVSFICLEEATVHAKTGASPANILSEKEPLYEMLWQTYFDHVNIPERKNKKLHLRHMPVRYWKYLTEKQARLQ
ncbi:TIGR03915 family putative DNA repair protein [Adhaeribacter sp. BT258]|uniref:TIGR03915 family putative DNA repair protein n=1 Tax=Adhaeribacter terrigena TaxID=2793070 RepID=A0ABS1C094_9BACT|nr:TIGR03915 family putative DNA repair protein [Adhaeribacter terrigena]MBK0401930.1 TIGR03915 family putative DNA repair protein [Adhaeribacter terrigena]